MGTLDNAWKGAEAYHVIKLPLAKHQKMLRLSPLPSIVQGPHVSDVVPFVQDATRELVIDFAIHQLSGPLISAILCSYAVMFIFSPT